MKKIMTWPLILVSTIGICQNYTLRRLNAEKINNSILFRLEKIDGVKRLTYEIDPRDAALKERNTSRSHIVKGDNLSLASKTTSFNILFDFLNPLKYSYVIKDEVDVDPQSKVYESFYQNLFDLAKKVNNSVDGSNSNNISVSQTITSVYETSDYASFRKSLYETIPKTVKRDSIHNFKSEELIDWILWYYNTFYDEKGIVGAKYDAKKKDKNGDPLVIGAKINLSNKDLIDNLIKDMLLSEKYIYDKIDNELAKQLTGDINGKLYFEAYLVDLFEDLSNTNSLKEFTDALEKIKRNIKQLSTYNSKASEVCKRIEGVVLINSTYPPEIYFNEYTKNKKDSYLVKVRGIINSRTGLLLKFQDLINDISEKYTSTISTPTTTKPHVVQTELGKLNRVNLKIIESNFTIENGNLKKQDQKLFNFDLEVSEYSSVIAELGLGTIFFPSINADNFTSSNGIVTKTTNKIFFSPMASLNLIPNISKGQAFWMVQIGVGSNIDKPAISLGTGVRIYNVRETIFRNFSISIGAVGCFVKQLNKLSEGVAADPALLDSDQFFAPIFRPYIGLQVNF